MGLTCYTRLARYTMPRCWARADLEAVCELQPRNAAAHSLLRSPMLSGTSSAGLPAVQTLCRRERRDLVPNRTLDSFTSREPPPWHHGHQGPHAIHLGPRAARNQGDGDEVADWPHDCHRRLCALTQPRLLAP
eukprot:scaffold17054_cov49-Phaeocystis_antarctica.AAC.2